MATAQQTYGLTVTLNGKTYGTTGTNSITSVTKAFEDNVTAADGTYATLATLSATAAAATLASVKGIMIVNNESSTTARVKVTDTGADEYIRELKAGSVMFLHSANLEVKTDGSGFSAFSSFDTVSVAGVGATASITIVALGT